MQPRNGSMKPSLYQRAYRSGAKRKIATGLPGSPRGTHDGNARPCMCGRCHPNARARR